MTERWGRSFPLGTLSVNVLGSLSSGFLTGLALYHAVPAVAKTVLGTGFCGAFTTFSTFAFETVRLGEDGSVQEGVANVVANTVGCLLAAAAGLGLAALL